MNKTVYEKPEFDFNDLFLFDGVAEKCWAYKSHTYTINIYKDKNHDDIYSDSEEIVATHTITVSGADSCNAAYESLYAQLSEVAAYYDKQFIESPAVAENAQGTIDGSLYIPIS